MESKTWSEPLLDALSLDASKLPELHPPGTQLGTLLDDVAELTSLKKNTPLFAAGGDGQCAGLGTNCTTPDRAYINLGTAVVAGIWSPNYLYDLAWRTELAAQGEGYIYESCLRSGAFLIDWFVDQFVAHGKADQAVFEKLEAQATELPIGSDGLLVQPYFSGVMNPHWDTSARGVILGLSGSHGPAHIYRAILEAITIDLVMGISDMSRVANQPLNQIIAIGGGANSPLWRQMLADATGKPVHISTTIEVTQAANAMSGATSAIEPTPGMHDTYAELLAIYRKLYGATSELTTDMLSFAEKQKI